MVIPEISAASSSPNLSNGSTTPPSIASGAPGLTPTKLATSSTVTSTSISASATSSSGSTVDKPYSSTAAHGFQQSYTTSTTSSSVYPVASGVTPGSLVPVAADPQSVMQAIRRKPLSRRLRLSPRSRNLLIDRLGCVPYRNRAPDPIASGFRLSEESDEKRTASGGEVVVVGAR
ncbi:hypothetical protein CC2G_014668 [Coprinopsis cinerea AmutBmut pab1-1]|nr:hypothetical protein CC2G_014668 [Coprinopsis cinerea AmutBmut pab1-1]